MTKFTLRKKKLYYFVTPNFKEFTNKSDAFEYAKKVLEREKKKSLFKVAEVTIKCREVKRPVEYDI